MQLMALPLAPIVIAVVVRVLVQRLHLFERGIWIANGICSYAAIPNN